MMDEKDQFLLVGSILNKVKYSTICINITAQSASLTRERKSSLELTRKRRVIKSGNDEIRSKTYTKFICSKASEK